MQTIYIHPDNPQPRLINQAVDLLKNDKTLIYPDDFGYQLAVALDSKNALDKLIKLADSRVKQGEAESTTLLCRNISEMAGITDISNQQHAIIKNNTPSAINFILDSSKSTPKKLSAKQKTIALRIPKSPIISALLSAIDAPIAVLPLVERHEIMPESWAIDSEFTALADAFINADEIDALNDSHHATVLDIRSIPTRLLKGAADVSHLVDE